jgi:hypothetical protein
MDYQGLAFLSLSPTSTFIGTCDPFAMAIRRSCSWQSLVNGGPFIFRYHGIPPAQLVIRAVYRRGVCPPSWDLGPKPNHDLICPVTSHTFPTIPLTTNSTIKLQQLSSFLFYQPQIHNGAQATNREVHQPPSLPPGGRRCCPSIWN